MKRILRDSRGDLCRISVNRLIGMVLVTGTLSACFLDPTDDPAQSSTGGIGGALGSSSTLTTSSEAGCALASDCPAPGDDCAAAVCGNGLCGMKKRQPGEPATTQVPSDCRVRVCLADGSISTEIDDSDKPFDGNECTVDECQAGLSINDPAAAGAPCMQDGGKLCDGAKHCVECNVNEDCLVPIKSFCHPSHVCVEPICGDGFQNSSETDIDCGGVCGSTCQVGSHCQTQPDCAMDLYCDETQVCAEKKGVAGSCSADYECKNGTCVDGVCCSSPCDGLCQRCDLAQYVGVCHMLFSGQDPDEECPGVTNCNGIGSCSTLSNGKVCTLDGECSSGFCVDGYCCDAKCDGLCRACSVPKKQGGSNGVCGYVAYNTDPDDECVGLATCNLQGGCLFLGGGQFCSMNAECGTGYCVDGVCCDSACDGVCQYCWDGGSCHYYAPSSDPENDCAGSLVCVGGPNCGPP